MQNKLTVLTVVTVTIITSLAIFFSGQINTAQAHCQVPCGIYNDAARIGALAEDVITISKAITKINELAGKSDATSINQAVRWVQTKDAHASNIIKVISEYFLTQKVKPVSTGKKGDYQKYLESLSRHHAVMVAAMKTKQNPTKQTAKTLSNALHTLSHDYVKHNH